MTNPYAHSSGGSAAPEGAPANPPLSPEDQLRADYELAIGPNRDYYLPKFEAFDAGGSKVSWHWPAFFVTSPWYIYRKMWLPGILNIAYPVFLCVVFAFVFALFNKSPYAVGTAFALFLVAPWVLMPMFANALYWRHVRGMIERLPRSLAQTPEKRTRRLERNGGTGVGPMIGVLAGIGFFFIFFVGIIAAISIPAYQDYTTRAQVTEGLNLAGPVKAQVAEHWARHGQWPEQADLGTEPPRGLYVNSVGVAAGSVVITYGGAVSATLDGKRLVLVPGVDREGDVVWTCGNAQPRDDVEQAEGPSGADMPNKWLPATCRGAVQPTEGS
jgi:Tfp pilus assembly major pilin PilA